MRKLNVEEMKKRTERHMQQHLAANKVKDTLGHEGYIFSMSLYGIINNPETNRPEYRRIEVFMRDIPTQQDVISIKNFFDEITPYSYYTIWAYDQKTKQILNIDRFR